MQGQTRMARKASTAFSRRPLHAKPSSWSVSLPTQATEPATPASAWIPGTAAIAPASERDAELLSALLDDDTKYGHSTIAATHEDDVVSYIERKEEVEAEGEDATEAEAEVVQVTMAEAEMEAETGKRRERKQHTFVCRHKCCHSTKQGVEVRWEKVEEEVLYVDGVIKHVFNKDLQKHEENASYHPCMCSGTSGLCPGIVDAYIKNGNRADSVRIRFLRKLEDGKCGHQVLYGQQVRGESGALKPGMKTRLIHQFGLHTLQDYDLDSNERQQKLRLVQYLEQHPGSEWQIVQSALFPSAPIRPARRTTTPSPPPAPAPTSSSPTRAALPSSSRRRAQSSGESTPLGLRESASVSRLGQQLRPVEVCEQLDSIDMLLLHHTPPLPVDRLDDLLTPFVHVKSVRNRVARSPSGAVVFTPAPNQRPTLCEATFKLEHEELYCTSTIVKESMTLRVLGEDTPTAAVSERVEFMHGARQGYTEAEFYEHAKRAMLRQGDAKRSSYAKDVELTVMIRPRGDVGRRRREDSGFQEKQRMGLWGALWGPAADGNWVQQSIDDNRKMLSAGMQLFARICRWQKPHPLNPHLFNVHPRSLVHILLRNVEAELKEEVDWVTVNDLNGPVESDGHRTVDSKRRKAIAAATYWIQFFGFCSPMVYVKDGTNFFKGHIEQLAASSFNRCDSGGQYWIVVPFSEQAKLLPLFDRLLRINDHRLGEEPLSADEHALLPTLLLSRQLFIPPDMLDKYGVKYWHYYQKAGDVMVLQGYSFHQGVVDNVHNHAHAEAVNYLDIHWLGRDDGGLRVVYEMCRWLRKHYARIYRSEDARVRPSLRALMFDTYREGGVCHFLPYDWSRDFLGILRDDIELWCGSGGGQTYLDYEEASVLTKEDGRVAMRRLQYILDTLESDDVRLLYGRNGQAVQARKRRHRPQRAETKRQPQPALMPLQASEVTVGSDAENERDVWPASIFTQATLNAGRSHSPQPSTAHAVESDVLPRRGGRKRGRSDLVEVEVDENNAELAETPLQGEEDMA